MGGYGLRLVGQFSFSTAGPDINLPYTNINGVVVDGDIMVMSLAHKGAGYATAPAGWTLIAQNISGSTRGEAWWKRASSESGTYTFTGVDDAVGAIVVYSGGLASGNPVEAATSQANASGVKGCAAITTLTDESLVIAIMAAGDNLAVSWPQASPTGLVYRQEFDSSTTASGLAPNSNVALAHTICAKAGSTGAFTFLQSSVENVCILCALKPEPNPASPVRFYPTTHLPHLGRFDGMKGGDWAATYNGESWFHFNNDVVASPTKTNGGIIDTTKAWATNQQGDFDAVLATYLVGPLTAQTISGTYQQCFETAVTWLSPTPTAPSGAADAKFKVHAYITQGFSTAVRHVLIDNYVDSALLADSLANSGFVTPPTIASGGALEGDYIRVEIGVRIVSSPTPTPNWPPGETWGTRILMSNMAGTTWSLDIPRVDAVIGGSTVALGCGWFEFSNGISLLTESMSPNNDSCANAIAVASLPYDSPRIDGFGSTDARKGIWFTYTAEEDGIFQMVYFGSNQLLTFDVYTGSCASPVTFNQLGTNYINATQGVTYRIRARRAAVGNFNVNGDNRLYYRLGTVVVKFFRPEAPQEDDLYLPNGPVGAFRNGVLVNHDNSLSGQAPTGVAIDYSGISLDVWGTPHTGERLLIGLHNSNLVEILDLNNMGFLSGDLDWYGNTVDANVSLVDIHPSTLQIRRSDNELFVGFFGNGYRYMASQYTNGSRFTVVLDSPVNVGSYGYIRSIGIGESDNQPGAPFTETTYDAEPEVTNAWAISLDEDAGIIYFTSGGYYIPVGGAEIRAYDIATGTTSVFATLSLQAGYNPGLKGLQFIPGGEILVCNSPIVQKLDSSGAVIGTFTPSIPEESRMLVDVKITADRSQFWVVSYTGRLWLVDYETMTEVATYPTYLNLGVGLVQMAIYQPSGIAIIVQGGPVALPTCHFSFLDPPRKALHDRFRG